MKIKYDWELFFLVVIGLVMVIIGLNFNNSLMSFVGGLIFSQGLMKLK